MQVVGQYAHLVQGFIQRDLGAHLVIDALEEHGLIEQGNAGFTQGCKCMRQYRSQFPGVVGMNDQAGGQSSAIQDLAEAGIQPGGQHHGKTAVDSQAADMGDFLQRFDECFQPVVAQHKGITTAEDDLADAGILPQLFQRRLPLVFHCLAPCIGEVAAETVAAIDGAGACGDEQYAALILVEYAIALVGSLVLQGVFHKAGGMAQFGGDGQYL